MGSGEFFLTIVLTFADPLIGARGFTFSEPVTEMECAEVGEQIKYKLSDNPTETEVDYVCDTVQ